MDADSIIKELASVEARGNELHTKTQDNIHTNNFGKVCIILLQLLYVFGMNFSGGVVSHLSFGHSKQKLETSSTTIFTASFGPSHLHFLLCMRTVLWHA